MKHVSLSLLLLLVLPACQDAVDAAQDVSHTTQKNTIATAEKLRDIFSYQRPKPTAPEAIPYVFCYRVMQDIMCYNEPIKGNQHRLVGWQGRTGFTGNFHPHEVTRPQVAGSDAHENQHASETTPSVAPSSHTAQGKAKLTPLPTVQLPQLHTVKSNQPPVQLRINESEDVMLY